MARSPDFKVYRPARVKGGRKEYVGSLKYAEDAAQLVASIGAGGLVCYGHRFVVWTEEREDFEVPGIPGRQKSAGASLDVAAEIMHERIKAHLADFERERARRYPQNDDARTEAAEGRRSSDARGES